MEAMALLELDDFPSEPNYKPPLMGQGFSMAMSMLVITRWACGVHRGVHHPMSRHPFSPRDSPAGNSPRFLMDELDLPHDRANLFEVPILIG